MAYNPQQRGTGTSQYPPNQRYGGQGGRGGPPHGGGGEPDLEGLLTPDCTVDYFDARGNPDERPTIRAALLDEDARAVAKDIRDLPASQLRRIYASVISLKRELEINPAGTSDELVRARLALFKAHAAYAKKRMRDMPDAFIKFIVRHVASVKTKDEFVYGFAPCFEAVVAYHKLFETKKRGE